MSAREISSFLWRWEWSYRRTREVAQAEQILARASRARNTRAIGAALREIKQVRTEAIRRENARRSQHFQLAAE